MNAITLTYCSRPVPHKWPQVNLEQIEAISHEGQKLAALSEKSPIRFEACNCHAEQVIDALFVGNPLLCCGANKYHTATEPRTSWRGRLGKMQFIVPSPMKARTGKTLEGKLSPRSADNTGPRRFLVVEFDFREKSSTGCQTAFTPLIQRLRDVGISVEDLTTGLLLHLAEIAPLSLVVHSGGKSLHGWFYCFGEPEAKLLQFMRYAVSLGADPSTWTACQLVRMPDGLRENRIRQRVCYLNPNTIK